MPDNLTSGTLNKAGRIVRKSGNDYAINLADWVRLWPTPRATDGSKGGRTEEGARKELARGKNVDLGVAVKMWPTPRAFMHKDSTTDRGKSNLGEVVGGQLNPMWVEWLMGFPLGWTDLEDSETQ
jgi:hypothetical protein